MPIERWHPLTETCTKDWMRPLLLLAAVVLPAAAAASPSPSDSALCEAAIAVAEHSASLPPRLLGAIAEVESGRPDDRGAVRPWPWTINAEGRGQIFASKREAVDAVRALQSRGVQSIDVGCMQVSLMHHPNAFASLDQAFDPMVNAQYAARFLNTLYGISGSWVHAAAAYHSQTPAIGAEYQVRVIARWRQRGPVSTPVAYRDFAPTVGVYGAFKPADQVYGAFAGPAPQPAPRLARR
jgi:hypothetical protein